MILSERNLFIYPQLINLPNDHGAAAKTPGQLPRTSDLCCTLSCRGQSAPVTSVCVSVCEGSAGKTAARPCEL